MFFLNVQKLSSKENLNLYPMNNIVYGLRLSLSSAGYFGQTLGLGWRCQKVFDTCLLLRLRFSLSEICCLLDIRSFKFHKPGVARPERATSG